MTVWSESDSGAMEKRGDLASLGSVSYECAEGRRVEIRNGAGTSTLKSDMAAVGKVVEVRPESVSVTFKNYTSAGVTVWSESDSGAMEKRGDLTSLCEIVCRYR